MPLTTKSGVKIEHTKNGRQYIDANDLVSKPSVQKTIKKVDKIFSAAHHDLEKGDGVRRNGHHSHDAGGYGKNGHSENGKEEGVCR